MKNIFVYGTLLKDFYNYDKYLKNKSKFIGYGYVKGNLYTIKDCLYPALVSGDKFIKGEIYQVNDDVIKSLDELEVYISLDNPKNEYNKIKKDILNENNILIDFLDVYCYNDKNRCDSLNDIIKENCYRCFAKKNKIFE